MFLEADAVGTGEETSFSPNGEASTKARLAKAETRLNDVEDRHEVMHDLLNQLLENLGHPEDGDKKATGVYRLLDNLNARMAPLERLRERVVGALWVAIPLLTMFGTVVWFLAGEKIAKLLH